MTPHASNNEPARHNTTENISSTILSDTPEEAYASEDSPLSDILSNLPEGTAVSITAKTLLGDLLVSADKSGINAEAKGGGWEIAYRTPGKGQPQAERTATRTKRKARGNAEATATGR